MSAVGDRVQLGTATGIIEKVRGDVAEILWDTGARCPVPIEELTDPEHRDEAKRAEESAARRDRRHRERKWIAAHAERECRLYPNLPPEPGRSGLSRPKVRRSLSLSERRGVPRQWHLLGRTLSVDWMACSRRFRPLFSGVRHPNPRHGQMSSNGRLLDAVQVAEMLGMRVDYVYTLARQDRIPHLRFGRTLRFRAEAIDRWLEESERGTLRGSR
jgi:excisionase family DNA binding protein